MLKLSFFYHEYHSTTFTAFIKASIVILIIEAAASALHRGHERSRKI